MFSPEHRLSPQYLSPELASHVAEPLVRSGAFCEGDFTFASGIKSPMKIESDVLRLPENFQVHRDISEFMFLMVFALGIKPDVVVGVIRGGISFAKDLSGFLDKPFASRLGFKRDVARQNEVRGFIPEGSNVLVIEDVVTFGTSSVPCVLDLRRNKANVLGVMSVYSYGFPQAIDNFNKHNVPHWSLLYFQDVIKELKRKGTNVEQYKKWYDWAPVEYERLKTSISL